ncbi:DinB family protein [Granulosicoccus antarcticus]|uniref:DinB family protein n=1 Tax=Granulosicoccus antarcticus IMCC3135 TaxID=1192854 RepID=A0A2Z2NI58_9GAMM|nr:DinB family protein [Granulosicoccus antarcticus]ASJ71012.1 hypothetical protein IMCC3135_04495 [Granulosicoccus antarcticus IMCC3135]
MGDYNRWMNESLYEAASTLPPAVLAEDRGAFFCSLLGTFNHLLVADTIWLQRFAHHPGRFSALEPLLNKPTMSTLDEVLYEDFQQLRQARQGMDEMILAFVKEAKEADYEQLLAYRNTKDIAFQKPFGSLMLHFFNHQTHHRGQVTVLLNQLGVDCGVTDLLVRIGEES